jgi:hypothetical protein
MRTRTLVACLVITVLALASLPWQKRPPQEKERMAWELESTDAAIGRLVYELYGRTEAEFRVVDAG